MTSDLFRKEVIEAQSERNVTGTTLVVPLSFSVYAMLVSVLATAILALLFFGEYSPKDTVRGYITTTEGNFQVYAQSDGTIGEVLVNDGDWVQSGQELLRLSTSRGIAQSAETRDSIMAALHAEQDSLSDEIESITESFSVKKSAYEDDIRSLEGRLALLETQKVTLLQAVDIAKREIERFEGMGSSGYVSSKEMDAAQSALVEINLRLRALELDSDDVRSAIRKNQAALLEHPHLLSGRIAEKQSEYQRLTARVAEGLGVSQQTVVAPTDGVVTGLLVRGGQTISANSPLLSLVPQEGTFYAELLVPTRTIGFVQSGAAVKIRYDAFPYQKYGTFDGVIEHIARTTTLPGDKSFPLPVSDAVYLARVTVLQQSIAAYEDTQPLQPGMTLTADVLRDKRRLIEWVFDPLISAKQRL